MRRSYHPPDDSYERLANVDSDAEFHFSGDASLLSKEIIGWDAPHETLQTDFNYVSENASVSLRKTLAISPSAVGATSTHPHTSPPARVQYDDQPSNLHLEENLVQYGWVSVFAVMIMTFVFLSAYWLRRSKYSRWMPESSVAIITGTLVGALVYLYDMDLVAPTDGSPSPFVFSPKLFFFAFLPPIILDAGYSLKKKHFFSNIGVVILYAGPGVLISTLVIGMGALLCSHAGVFGAISFRLIDALMFGALLSVTDSVATVSILGSPDLNFDSSLYSIVFGESVLNDAVGILVFDTLARFSRSAEVFSLSELAVELVLVFVGSIVLGLALGLLCSLAFRKLALADYPALEFLLIVLCAYMSYVSALVMQLSGVMALFVCGVVLGHYNWHNISVPSKTTTRYGFKAISLFCEMAVFVYLGITFTFSLTPSFHLTWSVPACVVTFLLVWIGRAAYVFPLSWLANLRRARPLTLPMQTIIFCGGLRGAVSFALALNVHGPHASMVITSTLSVVIVTSLLGGSLIDRIVRHLSRKAEMEHQPLATSAQNSYPEFTDSGEDHFLGHDTDSVDSLPIKPASHPSPALYARGTRSLQPSPAHTHAPPPLLPRPPSSLSLSLSQASSAAALPALPSDASIPTSLAHAHTHTHPHPHPHPHPRAHAHAQLQSQGALPSHSSYPPPTPHAHHPDSMLLSAANSTHTDNAFPSLSSLSAPSTSSTSSLTPMLPHTRTHAHTHAGAGAHVMSGGAHSGGDDDGGANGGHNGCDDGDGGGVGSVGDYSSNSSHLYSNNHASNTGSGAETSTDMGARAGVVSNGHVRGPVMQTSAVNKVLAQAQWGTLNQVWDTFESGIMQSIFGGPEEEARAEEATREMV